MSQSQYNPNVAAIVRRGRAFVRIGPGVKRIKVDGMMCQPNDTGPCPICGTSMGKKGYPQKAMMPVKKKGVTVDYQYRTTQRRGRYFHMLYEHKLHEDYIFPKKVSEAIRDRGWKKWLKVQAKEQELYRKERRKKR